MLNLDLIAGGGRSDVKSRFHFQKTQRKLNLDFTRRHAPRRRAEEMLNLDLIKNRYKNGREATPAP
jgi:hypothetical protein